MSINIDKYFDLRNPNANDHRLDYLQEGYKDLAIRLIDNTPENPDQAVALRKLKESMQTAISAIICADAFTPNA